VESVAPARVVIDGREVLDNTDVPTGGSFFGNGRHESSRTVTLEAGRTHDIVIELRHRFAGQGMGGINIGMQSPQEENALGAAVDLAARADLSVVVVGTNDDWESEGWDRESIDLPGDQNVLVEEVARVSKRTVVVVNSGSPVAMPWLDDVQGVVQAWFAGQEMGEALVDLLTGAVEPSGRLPVTFPRKLVDTPAAETHPGRNGKAQYLEGRLIGHRWYDKTGKEPLFPFGFGLGYADVRITAVSAPDAHTVEAELQNLSSRDGVQVVQVYAHRTERDGLPSDEPINVLVGYERVEVPAGATVRSRVAVNPDAYRTWDVSSHSWTRWNGPVELRVGTHSRDVPHVVTVTP
jgi:beta-glucosidase